MLLFTLSKGDVMETLDRGLSAGTLVCVMTRKPQVEKIVGILSQDAAEGDRYVNVTLVAGGEARRIHVQQCSSITAL